MTKMSAQRITISLPKEYFIFLDNYAIAHKNMNRSEVVKNAVSLLMEKQLIESYKEANAEHDNEFDFSDGDGLDETW